jgi:hypothetical protein
MILNVLFATNAQSERIISKVPYVGLMPIGLLPLLSILITQMAGFTIVSVKLAMTTTTTLSSASLTEASSVQKNYRVA